MAGEDLRCAWQERRGRASGQRRRGWGDGWRLRGGSEMEALGFAGSQLVFIRREHDFSRSFADEQAKLNGLFGPKQACYIPPT
jgi:hypothetical protein